MPVEQREPVNKSENDVGPGPYLAKVISHLDATFMGGLEVTLLRNDGNTVGESSQTYTVRYAPPFFGNTAFEFMGYNNNDFQDTQKSYGMWFIPPDVGVTVLVVFVDGRADQGFWLACVPGRFVNHMVPAIAASSAVDFLDGDAEYYDVDTLPVAEINRRSTDLGESLDIENIPRPVHPFADALLEQGLLADDVRGTTTSSARRNAPSSVFGISTPGPIDRSLDSKKEFIGTSESPSQTPVGISRLGGSSFVMDDGDDQYVRVEPAGDGPPEYAEAGSGDPGIPKDEYIRLRTRTGHQLLLHNSEDLIYIGNAKGTTWIELTSNGKIDIFAEDSISIHTKQDMNFYADRDINLEAGRNVNIKASATASEGGDTDGNGAPSGRLYMESSSDTRIVTGGDTKWTTTGDWHIATTKSNYITALIDNHFKSVMDTYLQSTTATHIKSGTTMNIEAGATFDLNVAEDLKISSGAAADINVGGDMKMTSGGDASLGGANITMQGGAINLNGPAAPAAAEAAAATAATAATPTDPLGTTENVIVDPFLADWPTDRYDPGSTLTSIMFRIPMHEPWPNHENLDPLSFTPEVTDREQAGGGEDGISVADAPADGGTE